MQSKSIRFSGFIPEDEEAIEQFTTYIKHIVQLGNCLYSSRTRCMEKFPDQKPQRFEFTVNFKTWNPK